MKGTDNFKWVIQAYLEQRANYDELFAHSFSNPDKSIDECITYILTEVQKSGYNGFSDDEIFGMAVHYYDETDIKIDNSINCRVVVNHVVELTEEEKIQARKAAVQQVYNEAYNKQKKHKKTITKQNNIITQKTLFDL